MHPSRQVFHCLQHGGRLPGCSGLVCLLEAGACWWSVWINWLA